MRIAIPSTTAALVLAAVLAWPASATALTDLIVHVDCSSGGRISQTLNRPTLVDRRLVVVVRGTCTENVTIERDDVVLRARSSGDGVNATDAATPAILIDGARRVALEGLSVIGGLHGVQVTGGGAATIRGSVVRNAARSGVLIDGSSRAVIDGSSIESNGENGIVAAAAAVTVTGSTVRANALYGLVASRGGSALIGNIDSAGNVCCGNTIEDNTFDGVLAADGSSVHLYGNNIRRNGVATGRFGILAVRQSSIVLRGGNLVSQNGSATGGGGVFARASTINTGPGDTPVNPPTNVISANTFGIQGATNSMVELRGGVSVTGNTFSGVTVDHGSRLRTDGSTISGNGAHGIFAGRASSVEFFNTLNVVTGNNAQGLSCADGESSHAGNVSGITGNAVGDVNCSGF